METSTRTQKTALVTGANGYIGNAVAQAFKAAGYVTFGLVRSPQSAITLQKHSIIPIVGSATDHENVLSAMTERTTTLNVVVSTTEDRKNYVPHFNATLSLFRALAAVSNAQGVRPLILFTSGCKDYGEGELHGSPNLRSHTEDSPLRPPQFLVNRATHAIQVLQEESFDSAVLRPTLVHGGSSSHLGGFFDMAAAAKSSGGNLRFPSDPRTIVHSMNVHDCAEAYVALANSPDRAKVTGECFNISPGDRYETLGEIGKALVELYKLPGDAEYDIPSENIVDASNALTNFSQLVASEKIRKLTGWADDSPMFAQDIARYRAEYESTAQNRQ